MINLITEIIQKFGPRPAGSEAEKNAQLFMQAKCREYTGKVEYLPFEEYLNARFGKLKYYVAIYIAALALYPELPVLSLMISLVNAFFIVFDLMMYRDILTSFPGKKETSANVEAVLEPQEEVKSTLIVAGHIDSTLEYTWWYKFGETGVKLTIAAGVLMVLQALFFAWHLWMPAPFHFYLWLLFIVLTPVMVVYWNMHGDTAVPGACDNLSGIAIAFEVFRNFASKDAKGKSTLRNTRIKFVSFGSEEKGLCGSSTYVKQKNGELNKENAWLLNIDSVRLVEQVSIVKRELMNGTSHTPRLVSGLQQAFQKLGLPVKTVMLPIGGTDAVSFARVGLPSVTIIGMSSGEYDFTYHTRHDIVENLESKSLENVRAALVQFVKDWDENTDVTR